VGRRLSSARHMGPMVNGGPLGPAYPGVEEGVAGIPPWLHPPHFEGEEVGIPFHLRSPNLRREETEICWSISLNSPGPFTPVLWL